MNVCLFFLKIWYSVHHDRVKSFKNVLFYNARFCLKGADLNLCKFVLPLEWWVTVLSRFSVFVNVGRWQYSFMCYFFMGAHISITWKQTRNHRCRKQIAHSNNNNDDNNNNTHTHRLAEQLEERSVQIWFEGWGNVLWPDVVRERVPEWGKKSVSSSIGDTFKMC